MRNLTYTLPRYILAVAMLAACQACAPTGISTETAVAQAYNSPGVIKVPVYTRSIINTHNF